MSAGLDSPRVTRARLGLMLEQPFLASAIARLPLVDATHAAWCPTAATDGYYIHVNLAFAETLNDKDLAFVLAHEVLHCVLGHPDRRGTRERFRWNVAIDFATNALLVETGFTPPAQALYDRRYAGMTAESIYDALPVQAVERISATVGRDLRSRAEGEDDERTRHPGASAGYDLHLEEGDPEGAPSRAREFPSSEERRRLRAELALGVKSRLSGTAAGYWAEELRAGTTRDVPWQELLARFVSGVRRADYRIFPPHRKHLWRGLYLPSLGVPGPDLLVVVVDTSGSMSGEELSQIFGEIDALRAAFECRVTVLQCDVVIHQVEEHEPWDELVPPTSGGNRVRVHGRGGTDLRPPFAWVEERLVSRGDVPDALIYCTDGFGPFPTSPPEGIPVLWVMTHQSATAVPFGAMVKLPSVLAASGR